MDSLHGETIPNECDREDVHMLARPFTQLANELGDARAGNMVMLGALLADSRGLAPGKPLTPRYAAWSSIKKWSAWTSARWPKVERFTKSRYKS